MGLKSWVGEEMVWPIRNRYNQIEMFHSHLARMNIRTLCNAKLAIFDRTLHETKLAIFDSAPRGHSRALAREEGSRRSRGSY